MSDITIYCSPFCVISRNALALIRDAGIEPAIVEYIKTPPSRSKLLELLGSDASTGSGAGENALAPRG